MAMGDPSSLSMCCSDVEERRKKKKKKTGEQSH
jgi:hypothetical protein